ncbi:hypothetical protein NOF04DRAFT_14019 [Fusarium oxysporum II5]|uniref:Rhodopsin domain-containing protein n=3 Tax=Fusarium oxysporum species complex TaxID=171631 RepID=N1S6M5_FUSC4|nr:uncharacterized protein FOIG_13832 [Fusarium odoratissimum NRRL 54006]EMT74498.1 hypothetical protein FOC4_g10000961 [Fusarium odoratissimum]EXL93186.1 hypothetical protein FOIG_13832 [Fusarium odoratissimum NRRL 54006]KAK2132237.1 hypothetical protein NOF04DRAFT_14019 [Fusarium oxysporum II5]TXC07879.1 hypothetical protein FocTR4_00002358 [Fusarium oxysporum f. sp. cubense]
MVSAPSGEAVTAVTYSLVSLAAVLIAARIYLRLFIQKQRLLLSDLLIIAAWFSAFMTIVFGLLVAKYNTLRPELDYTLMNWDAPLEAQIYVARLSWAAMFPFLTTFYLCKASLLAVYLQLFPTFMKTRRILLWITIAYCAAAYIVTISLQLFLCLPVWRNWAINQPEKLCPDDDLARIFQIAWALHFAGSLALFALPWLIVYKVQMKRKIKIGVYSVFLLGLVDITFSLTRFLSVQLGNVGQFRSVTTIELWSSLDSNIGLIIACLPALRPFLRRNRETSEQYNNRESSRNTRTVTARRHNQAGFEEIEEDISINKDGSMKLAFHSSNSRRIGDGWSDRAASGSDIELVNVEVVRGT